MVEAGSQERRMAERQANGRPGTDKERGAGTLEAQVREPQGPRQGAVLVPYLMVCAWLPIAWTGTHRHLSPPPPITFVFITSCSLPSPTSTF